MHKHRYKRKELRPEIGKIMPTSRGNFNSDEHFNYLSCITSNNNIVACRKSLLSSQIIGFISLSNCTIALTNTQAKNLYNLLFGHYQKQKAYSQEGLYLYTANKSEIFLDPTAQVCLIQQSDQSVTMYSNTSSGISIVCGAKFKNPQTPPSDWQLIIAPTTERVSCVVFNNNTVLGHCNDGDHDSIGAHTAQAIYLKLCHYYHQQRNNVSHTTKKI